MIKIRARDFTSLTSSQEFLTNMPRPYRIGLSESLRLSFFDANSSQVLRVRARDSSGAAVFVQFLNLTPLSFRNIRSVGVGTRNLSNTVFPSATFNPALYDTYEVQAYTTSDVGGQPTTEAFEFVIEEPVCGSAYRIHFMNQYGALDSVTFYSEVEQFIRVRSSVARSPESIPFTREETGRARFGIDASQQYQLVTQNLTNAELEWIKELAMSPVVALEVQAPETFQYVPILIDEDSSFPVFSTEEKEQQYQISFRLSKDLISHL